MRLVFLGSPPFAVPVLARVLTSGHTLAAVVTRPDRPQGRGRKVEDSPLSVLARERGIPLLQPETARDPAFVAALRALEPDVLLVASYGEILRREVLELAPGGALNVHASLLPRHRGASPIQAAILAGDAETGVSVQRMVLALDEGDVLVEERTPIGAHENAGELLERLALLGGEAAVRALDLVDRGAVRAQPQDSARATYAPKIKKEHGRIVWSTPAVELDRFVRAMTPWPGARTRTADGLEIVVLEGCPAPCDQVRLDEPPAPGTIVAADRALLVATGRGSFEIRALKPAAKPAMSADAWLRGARVAPGARFA